MTTNANGNTKLLTASNSNFTKYTISFMQELTHLTACFCKNNARVCPQEKDRIVLCNYASLEDIEMKDEKHILHAVIPEQVCNQDI